MTAQEKTLGQEIMRSDRETDSRIAMYKEKFAELYDFLTTEVMTTQALMDQAPNSLNPDSIKVHMEVIRKGEEQSRCMSEACNLLELACMWAVKGLTA